MSEEVEVHTEADDVTKEDVTSQEDEEKKQEALEGKDADRQRKDERSSIKHHKSSQVQEKSDSLSVVAAPEEIVLEEVEVADDYDGFDDDEEEDETAPPEPNTYRLEPVVSFNEKVVSLYMSALLEEELNEYVYEPETGPKVARALTMTIMQKIHTMKFGRHKLIVVVDVVERIFQALHSSVRFLWDADRDNLAMATMQKDTFCVVCCVFALYYD